jgi:polyisoprenoid-binding protein YceI
MVGASPLAGARMTLTIKANSLEAAEGGSDKDRDEINRRMRQEVLETDDYPEIVYECTGVTASGTGDRYWVALKGELTLHGTTKSMPVSARVTINGTSLRASGDFALRQSDFGIALVSAAAGTIRVKDEVKCTFDILAHRQE